MNEELFKKLFGKRIKNIRKSRKLTQEKLAETIGIEPAHLCKMENGTHFPSLKTLLKLVNILEIEITDLFTFDIQRKNPLLERLHLDLATLNEKELNFIHETITNLIKMRNK